MITLLLALAVVPPAGARMTQGPVETVTEIRVHGNYATPEADVLAIIGPVVGQPATDALVADLTRKLVASGRFSGVEVRKRYRSIADLSQVLLVVVIDERPGATADAPVVGPWKRITASGMWLPVLQYDDGYGFTYGARVSFVKPFGEGSRVSAPVAWGGTRQAAVELEKAFAHGPVARVTGGVGVERRVNPHFDLADRRVSVRVRVETAPRRWLRAGAGGHVSDVDFGGARDRLTGVGADLAVDTRVDPAFPRNAVFASAGWERLSSRDLDRPAGRVVADVRGYAGLFGQLVLAVRGYRQSASGPLPLYEQALLGGLDSVRGYRVGRRAGDSLALLSAELRLPITSPLSVGRVGLKAFVDAGTAWAHGDALRNQTWDRGWGGGMFFDATVLHFSLDVARARTGDTRAHVSLGVTLPR